MPDFEMGQLLDAKGKQCPFPSPHKLESKAIRNEGDVEERTSLLIRQQDLRAFKVSGLEATAELRSVHGEGSPGTHK